MKTYDDQHVQRCRMKTSITILCIACGSVVAAWGQSARDYTEGIGLDLFNNSRILIDSDDVANQHYADLFHAWELNRGWETFAIDLHALIERFRSGWMLAPIADRVRADLENRLDDSGPPLLDGVSEEEQALALELADAPVMHRQYGFWIFPRSALQQPFSGPEGIEDHPISRIKAMGVDAVPFLLAMLDDRYPMPMSWQALQRGGIQYRPTRGQVLDEQWTWRLFDSMQRPATRGDVARVLLAHLVREAEDWSVSGMSPAQVRATTETWWERFGKLDVEEIARIYLHEGHREQRAAAGLHLMHTGDPADMALVEQAIRSASDPVVIADLVLNYAQVKRVDSRALVKPYIEELKRDIENHEGELTWSRHGLPQVLNRLNASFPEETLQAYLADVLAGNLEFDGFRFQREIAQVPEHIAVAFVLSVLAETSDPTIVEAMTTSLRDIRNRLTVSRDDPPEMWMIHDFVDQWQTLLRRTDMIPERKSLPSSIQARVVRLFMIMLMHKDGVDDHLEALTHWGRPGMEYYVAWAGQLLEDPGKGFPPLPSGDDISHEARAELTQRVLSTPPVELAAVLNDLSFQGRVALHEEMDENSVLRQHVISFANRVVWAEPFIGHERCDWIDELAASHLFSADLIRSLMDRMKEETSEGRAWNMTVMRDALLQGVGITYWLQTDAELASLLTLRDQPEVLYRIRSPVGNSFGMRRAPRTLDLQDERFWERIEQLTGADTHPELAITFRLQALPLSGGD